MSNAYRPRADKKWTRFLSGTSLASFQFYQVIAEKHTRETDLELNNTQMFKLFSKGRVELT